MNMFVLRPLLPEGSIPTAFGGVLPFLWAGVIRSRDPDRIPDPEPVAAGMMK
jgi:hypothetical protein